MQKFLDGKMEEYRNDNNVFDSENAIKYSFQDLIRNTEDKKIKTGESKITI